MNIKQGSERKQHEEATMERERKKNAIKISWKGAYLLIKMKRS
jgi:hypothetical protein